MKETKVVIKCHDERCLNNKNMQCVANNIVVGGTGRCKCYIDAKHAMIHTEPMHNNPTQS